MEIAFRTKNDKQLLAAEYWIDNITEEILYGGAKGGGKSYLGASLIFGDALIYPETHYFIARKELIDLRMHTVPTVHQVFKGFGLEFDKYASYNGQDHCFNLYNGSKVYLIACRDEPSDPLFERFGSMQMTRGWIEEGGEVPENAKANLWLAIGRWKNDEYGLKKKLLITANPKKGWMKRDFIEPYKTKMLPPRRRFVPAFATDNPYLPTDYLASLRDEKDTVRRQRLWEGNWDYDDDLDSLVNADALSDAFSNTIVKDGSKYLIVDVARKGRDKTVFGYWEGLELYKVDLFTKQTTDVTEQKIKDVAAAHKIPYSNILIDDGGIGGGVVDHLFGVKGFVSASSPIATAHQIRERLAKVEHSLVPKTVFGNLKSQCGWKLAELINEHQIAFRLSDENGAPGVTASLRDMIIEEITELLRDKEVDGDKRKYLKDKDEVKASLGRSPDVGDMLIMRAFFELQKAATGINDVQHARVVEEQSVIFRRARKGQSTSSSE